MEKWVAAQLNKIHVDRAEKINKARKAPSVFLNGDKVWYLRPKDDKAAILESKWVGPCEVVSRVGKDSYDIILPNKKKAKATHATFLKPWEEETLSGVSKSFKAEWLMTKGDDEVEPDEYEIQEILKVREDKKGRKEFLVWWKGWPKSDSSWEPLCKFFVQSQLCEPLIKFCLQNGVKEVPVKDMVEDPPRGSGSFKLT